MGYFQREISSEEYYDLIHNEYNDISQEKAQYLGSINKRLIEMLNKFNPSTWLDIGSGDGLRLLEICKKLRKRKDIEIDLLEPSLEMFNLAKQRHPNSNIYNNTLEDFSKLFSRKYNFITALWNVIGHAKSQALFLNSIYELMHDEAVLFIDANNQYNLKAYGAINVLKNIYSSLNTETNSLFNLKFSNSNQYTNVYIQKPYEIEKKLYRLGFSSVKTIFLNYNTGIKETPFTGQILVCAIK